ncbi:HlyD family efflux transporter periplasmic adaptor subunit [Crateriforma spongiae]|uniref:HlyD family efflux transporter periplasmic adaptor subunit n=1 Tax=Crateriforma spongiae TaxID=2724528 RepID=UPI0014451882|nr:HlyD family efflux transporter periplasmic adaptor subunit [Crateriforma spongiae]
MAESCDTLDVMTRPVRLEPGLRFRPVRQRGRWLCQIEQPSQHRFFRIGPAEYALISFFDGQTTLAQACAMAAAKLGCDAPSTERAKSVLQWMVRQRLASFADNKNDVRINETAAHLRPRVSSHSATAGNSGRTAWWHRFNPFWIKVPLPNVHRVLDSASIAVLPLYRSLGCILWSMLILVGLGMAWIQRGELLSGGTDVFDPDQWAYLIGIWLVLKLVHELGHTAACRRYGVKVRQAGIVAVLLMPMVYVDLTDAWMCRSRRKRMIISAAGIYLELGIAAIAVLGWTWSDDPVQRLVCHQVLFAAGVSTVLFNANPLMRFDGYYLLADAFDFPNLYSVAQQRVASAMRWLLLGQRPPDFDEPWWRRWAIDAYGWASLFWKGIIAVTLVIAAAWMFQGAGVLIAILGITQWVGRPLVAAFKTMKQESAGTSMLRPAFVTFVGVGLITGIVFWMPFPTRLAAPAVVRFPPECSVRCGVDGFVTAVFVREGQWVSPGDVLASLENDALRIELADVEIQLQQIEQQQLTAIHQLDAAADQIFQQRRASLISRRDHLAEQVDRMRLVAHRPGRVEARGLQERLGTYVQKGDSLMKIVDDGHKEVVALVNQAGIRTARRFEGDATIFASEAVGNFTGKLERIEPQATDRLPTPALAATSGGPMAVRTDESPEETLEPNEGPGESIRLVEPHFMAIARLDEPTAKRVPAGLLVEARLGYRDETIAQRVRTALLQRWYDDAADSNRR